MIPKPIEKLARAISRDVAERRGWEVPDPEQWLVVLLSNIKERMEKDSSYAMLESTVERAFSEDDIKQAGKLLKRGKNRKIIGTRKNQGHLSATR